MFSLACAIIMLHAFVPHHHDDCCGQPECFFCSEHHHNHEAHHHDHESNSDPCKLQDMLSHLVLSSRHDEVLLPSPVMANLHTDFMVGAGCLAECCEVAVVNSQFWDRRLEAVSLCSAWLLDSKPLRAPPLNFI